MITMCLIAGFAYLKSSSFVEPFPRIAADLLVGINDRARFGELPLTPPRFVSVLPLRVRGNTTTMLKYRLKLQYLTLFPPIIRYFSASLPTAFPLSV